MAAGALMADVVLRAFRQQVPLNVHFDLTYRCNERCVHCYLDQRVCEELTFAEIKGLGAQLRELGTLFLTLSGGEPFLRSDIFDILEHARQLHFDVCLKTNATLLDRQKVARLKQLGVRSVQVSVYSADGSVHDAITRVPGSLARSLAAIHLLLHNAVAVKISCPVMTINRNHYEGVIELANRLGIPYTIDPTISPSMSGDRRLVKLRTSPDSLLPILQTVHSDPRSRFGELPATARSRTTESEPMGDAPCGAGHNSVYISPFGDVYPCVQMPVPAGNVRQALFSEIWRRSDNLGQVRSLTQDEICGSCSIRMYCQRCPGLALMEQQSASAPYGRACEMAEARARLAGEIEPRSALHWMQVRTTR